MSICVGCGMCCDGTLFTHARLNDEEVSQKVAVSLGKRGGVVTEETYGTTLRHPCAIFDGEGCSAYEERPSICRSFRCDLLKNVESGLVDEDEARTIIQKTTSLRDKVRPDLERLVGASEPKSFRRLFPELVDKLEESPHRAELQRTSAPLLMDIAALRQQLTAHFGAEKADSSDLGEWSMR